MAAGSCPHIPQHLLERYAPVHCPTCGGMVNRDGTVTRPPLARTAAAFQAVRDILAGIAWLAFAGLMLLLVVAIAVAVLH